eukprot:scaffold15213_cov52-Phaeocystis_antarctica.AAC.3
MSSVWQPARKMGRQLIPFRCFTGSIVSMHALSCAGRGGGCEPRCREAAQRARAHQPEGCLRAGLLLVTPCPPLERLKLGAGRFLLVAPAVAEEARHLAVPCLDRLLGEFLGAAKELCGVGECLVRVGARYESRDRRRLLLLAAAAAEPAQPPVKPPAVPGGGKEGVREEEGTECNGGRVVRVVGGGGVGGDESGD